MSDEELLEQLPGIGVIARVAPEDKVRLVRMLQQSGNIVAMTGDGVNDAPALKSANIGVAMGITGTEVSKEAAVMILTDDNFATIVGAVEYGRGLYDNLLKYLRFQMSTLVAYIAIFIGAGIFDIGRDPARPTTDPVDQHGHRHPHRDRARFDEPSPASWLDRPGPSVPPCLSTKNWVRLCVQGFSDDHRDAGRLSDRRIGLRPSGRVHDAADHAVAVPPGRGIAGSRPGAHDLQPSRPPVPRSYAGTGWRCSPSSWLPRSVPAARLLDRRPHLAQWGICTGIALSLVVVEEVIKVFIGVALEPRFWLPRARSAFLTRCGTSPIYDDTMKIPRRMSDGKGASVSRRSVSGRCCWSNPARRPPGEA